MESVYRSVVATLSGDNFYVDCKGATIFMDDFLETASRDGYYLVSTSPFKLFPSPIEIAPQQQKGGYLVVSLWLTLRKDQPCVRSL